MGWTDLKKYVAVYEALFASSYNADGSWIPCAATAYGLTTVCCNFDFIMTMIIAQNCLAYTRPATVKLQSSHLDIMEAYSTTSVHIKSLQKVRDAIHTYHSSWYNEACKIATSVDVVIREFMICDALKEDAPENSELLRPLCSGNFDYDLVHAFRDALAEKQWRCYCWMCTI